MSKEVTEGISFGIKSSVVANFLKSNKFGYANIIKKRGSKVAGAIWEITKEHEKILDNYEQFPNIYQKQYFYLGGKKIMFYIMKKYIFKDPPKSYIDTINQGYEDCNIDLRINYRF